MEISTNKQIRWRQFRALANDILSSAKGPWGRTDRIGDLARAMERAYAAGEANREKDVETEVSDGVVRWEAIPARAQDALQDMSIDIRRHLTALCEGSLIVMLEGAFATGRKGDRARMSLWRPAEDGTLQRVTDLGTSNRDWAATSVSALLRLGIFQRFELTDGAEGFAELTRIGIETVKAAIEAKQIFTFDHLVPPERI